MVRRGDMLMKKKQKKIGRPCPVLYHMYLYTAALILRIHGVRLKIDRSGIKDMRGPALILAPHISLKDHILVGLTLLPHRPTFVLSEHFMTKPIIRPALKHLGRVITKKMFCPDVSTIMGIIRAKNEGNVIVLFPEGRLNSVAHSQKVTPGTAQLVKKLGVDVYTVTGNGSALVFPKWGEKYRKGKINVTTQKLISKDDISGLSVDEISKIVDNAIYHDDEKAMAGEEYICKNPAEGLESVLYKCPDCNSEYELTSKESRVMCKSCGAEFELGLDYRFKNGRFGSVNEWFYWQIDELSVDTVLEDDIKIGTPDEKGNMDFNAGAGHIRLDKSELRLTGEVFGEDVSCVVKTDKIGGMPYTPMREFDIYKDKCLLYLQPSDGRRIIKYVTLVDKINSL